MMQTPLWPKLEDSAKAPVWISTEADLTTACRYWQTRPMIAIDTEFQRVDTFYPIPGLIQVADDKTCYLIDPLAIKDLSALAELFRNPDVLKVLHAGSEDLELFVHSLGVLPAPVFDTQLAAAFIGWGFTMGLQRLVEHALGVELKKGETTSDWLGRPLSPQQEEYAALDVAYLQDICQMQTEQLNALGRLSWLKEEAVIVSAVAIDSDPQGETYYQRFSQMYGMPEYKTAALRDLTKWREQTCRTRDVPRNRILRNQHLLEIINRWPKNKTELGRVPELRARVIKEDGDTILAILAQARDSAQQRPVDPIQKPLPVIWNKRLKKLKARARTEAERLGMAPEVLLRKKDLDALVRSRDESSDGQYHLPEGLLGWRKSVIGEPLLALLQQFD